MKGGGFRQDSYNYLNRQGPDAISYIILELGL